jgi:threonine aldolase
MKRIDLRSDTVTLPTPEMRQAMATCPVGDDVFGEDPTANQLQERCAQLLNKDAALFVASGTMGNLISVLAHCQRSEEAIVGHYSHIAIREQAGAAAFGGVSLRSVPNEYDGTISLKHLQAAINSDDPHQARSKLIALENTWNGRPLTLSYMAMVKELALANGLNVHLDGARLFNAALALGTTVDKLAEQTNSVQFCFSKGLSAPAGSIIAGSHEFIAQARRLRKALGGGMRQVGVLAAACAVALDTMVERLEEDHSTARYLAERLEHIKGLSVTPENLRTNMVFFESHIENIATEELARRLREVGVLVLWDKFLGIRAVTHYGITIADIDEAMGRIPGCLK